MARTYFIGSDAVYVAPNWGISDKINARSTLSIVIVDILSATINNGKTFTVYEDAAKIFEGIIVNYTTSEPMKLFSKP